MKMLKTRLKEQWYIFLCSGVFSSDNFFQYRNKVRCVTMWWVKKNMLGSSLDAIKQGPVNVSRNLNYRCWNFFAMCSLFRNANVLEFYTWNTDMWVLYVNTVPVLDCDWMFARKTFEQFVLTMQEPPGTVMCQSVSLTLSTALAQMKTTRLIG